MIGLLEPQKKCKKIIDGVGPCPDNVEAVDGEFCGKHMDDAFTDSMKAIMVETHL